MTQNFGNVVRRCQAPLAGVFDGELNGYIGDFNRIAIDEFNRADDFSLVDHRIILIASYGFKPQARFSAKNSDVLWLNAALARAYTKMALRRTANERFIGVEEEFSFIGFI